VERRTFSALITFDPSAREAAVQRYLDGMRTYAIVKPRFGTYFPAVICPHASPSAVRTVHATVRIPLLAGEAALFTVGQAFTVAADAIVGDDTIRGEGLLGVGVVLGQELAAPPTDFVRHD
jgi:hypothetical protein